MNSLTNTTIELYGAYIMQLEGRGASSDEIAYIKKLSNIEKKTLADKCIEALDISEQKRSEKRPRAAAFLCAIILK